MSMMLPFGNTTLVWVDLWDHAAAGVTCVHDWLYSSSPKYHAHPVGEFADVSVKETFSGTVPVSGATEKLATGTAAWAVTVQRRRKRPRAGRPFHESVVFFTGTLRVSEPDLGIDWAV